MTAAAGFTTPTIAPAANGLSDRWIPQNIQEVYDALPEGTRAELVNDILYMPPAPELPHQETSMDLGSEIRSFLKRTEKGKVYAAPTDVALDGKKKANVQPDLIVVLNDQLHMLADGKRINGAPAILVEILSSDAKRDTEFKLKLYAKYGVREYFIVDPVSKTVTCYSEPKDGVYQSEKVETKLLRSDVLGADFRF